MQLTRNTHLTKIPPSFMSRLYRLIDVGAKYKELAENLTKRNGDQMFDSEEISYLDMELMKPRGSPSRTVFQRWSYECPNIGEVVDKLLSVDLVKQAEFIRTEILHETAMEQPNLSELQRLETKPLQCDTSSSEENTSSINLVFEPGCVQNYRYKELKACTQCFCRSLKIGSGGFSQVYKGTFNSYDFAVKIFKDVKPENIMSHRKQFETEIRALTSMLHENILTLYGYSIDGPSACIVYEYMPQGSLEDRLACRQGKGPLSISERVSILRGTAEGIAFIHANNKIHRDIKSANVLLTKELVPKIGDFGTLREGPQQSNQTHTYTEVIQGTHGYMAPEYYECIISPGLDLYAFGVIVMECLTGLPCFDPVREEKYMVSYIKENCDTEDDVLQEVEQKVAPWGYDLSVQMYRLALKLWGARKQRPPMTEVLQEMEFWKVA